MQDATSGIQVEQTPDRFVLTGGDLRLEFLRRNDRWHHCVLLRSDSDAPWREILKSIEGTAEDFSPPSAALQDCFLQEIEPGTQELQLLGQAAKNVYSAAIRFKGPQSEIDFDYCLRTPVNAGVPTVLASYEILPFAAINPTLHEGGRVCHIPAAGNLVVEFGIYGDAESSQSAAPLQWDKEQRTLRIGGDSAAEVTANAARRSLRWRYRLRLSGSA